MSRIQTAVIQMHCTADRAQNLDLAETLVRRAAAGGARIILLPELFEREYFCQQRRYAFYDYAEPLHENAAVKRFCTVAKELAVVLPVCFYERDGMELYNSVAVIDADGSILGVYRKTHIPDDHFYQEKFYFTPGNTGFRIFETRYARLGIGICWDQWFPECARAMALMGAEMLLYPTAIGSEPPAPGYDSQPHWEMAMRGHAAANIMPVVASNRIGREVAPGGTEVTFYGSSFISDHTGQLLAKAGREAEEVLVATVDLDAIAGLRASWGLFRDRRVDLYGAVGSLDGRG